MNHVSAGMAQALDEDRIAVPPPSLQYLNLEIEAYEKGMKRAELAGGKKAQDSSILWMEMMTRKDTFRTATGKGHESAPDVSRKEKYALSKLFLSLKGSEWNRKNGWIGMPKTNTRPELVLFEGSATLFEGVECKPLMSKCLLAGINLCARGAYGELPREVGDFETLRQLDLSLNLVNGPLTPYLGMLESLEDLNLAGNCLAGEIQEAALQSLVNLKQLNVSSNHLSGALPSDVFRGMTALRQLDLSNNALSGPLPPSLSRCTKLERLNLSCNALSGEMPLSTFSLLVQLKDVNLSQNNLSGHGFCAFAKCEQLQQLKLSENFLSGHLEPNVVAALTRLQILYLHKNKMGGFVPPEICQLTTLRRLNLSSNFFRGSLPADFGNLVKLETLLFTDNEIIAPLPRSLSALVLLRDFAVTKNYPSEQCALPRGFKKEVFQRIHVDGLDMQLNSVTFLHEDVYGPVPKNEERFELFERRLYRQRGQPSFLGKM